METGKRGPGRPRKIPNIIHNESLSVALGGDAGFASLPVSPASKLVILQLQKSGSASFESMVEKWNLSCGEADDAIREIRSMVTRNASMLGDVIKIGGDGKTLVLARGGWVSK